MVLQLLFLITAASLAWIWTLEPTLSFYSLQLTAFLVLIYFIKNLLAKKKRFLANKLIDSLILTIIVLLLVFSTGGSSSPLFFLLYFLLFGISFLFQPWLTVSFSFFLVLIMAIELNSTEDLLRVISLIFVAPLALFFGQQYLQNLANKKRIRILKKNWLKNEKIIEKEETNILFWLSINFRTAMTEISEITANLLADLSRLSPSQKSALKRIRRKLKKLSKEGRKLAKIIDQQTDEN